MDKESQKSLPPAEFEKPTKTPPHIVPAPAAVVDSRSPFLLELEGSSGKGERFDFKVRLHFHALAHLGADARKSIRLYELFRISRPGTIWKYLWVEVVDVPKAVHDRVGYSRKESGIESMRTPWPVNFIPFVDFDRLFYWCYDDTEPEDASWIEAREKPIFRNIADEELAKIRSLQDELRQSQDALIVHEVSQIDEAKHRFDYVAEPGFSRTLPDYKSVTSHAGCSSEYYDKLQSILAGPEVKSVAVGGDSDFEVNRLVCLEQRRRANVQNERPRRAFLISMSSDGVGYMKEWEADVFYFTEGIGDAELFIAFDRSMNLKKMVLNGPRRRYPILFSPRDDGEIDGYEKEAGPGWVLYRRIPPFEYRPIHPPR